MGSGVTAKWALPYPLGTDAPNVPGDMQALAQQVDAVFAGYSQGTLGLRPLASKSGRLYGQTDDIGGLWRDDGANWNSVGGRVQATAAGSIAQIIKGVVAQTADLQQWQNSSGTVVAKVTPTGQAQLSSLAGISGARLPVTLSTVQGTATTDVSQIVKAVASQTADLTQWQDSTGVVNASISAAGLLTSKGLQVSGAINLIGASVLQTSTNSNTPLTVKGAVGQTVDLQQWQDSTAVVKASIGLSGNFRSIGKIIAGTFVGDSGSAQMQAWSTNVGAPAFVALGAAGQSANVFETRDSSSITKFQIGPTGSITTPGSANFSGSLTSAESVSFCSAATIIASVVRAATAQTASIQEWQNSAGTMLSKVASDGSITAPKVTVTSGPVPATQCVVKAADESRSNAVVPTNDAELLFTAQANSTYIVEMGLLYVAGDFNTDLNCYFGFPAGASVDFYGIGAHNTDLTAGTNSNGEWVGRPGAVSGTTVVPFGAGTTLTGATIRVHITTGATAGTVNFMWRQGTSSANALTIKAGSWLEARKVA